MARPRVFVEDLERVSISLPSSMLQDLRRSGNVSEAIRSLYLSVSASEKDRGILIKKLELNQARISSLKREVFELEEENQAIESRLRAVSEARERSQELRLELLESYRDRMTGRHEAPTRNQDICWLESRFSDAGFSSVEEALDYVTENYTV